MVSASPVLGLVLGALALVANVHALLPAVWMGRYADRPLRFDWPGVTMAAGLDCLSAVPSVHIRLNLSSSRSFWASSQGGHRFAVAVGGSRRPDLALSNYSASMPFIATYDLGALGQGLNTVEFMKITEASFGVLTVHDWSCDECELHAVPAPAHRHIVEVRILKLRLSHHSRGCQTEWLSSCPVCRRLAHLRLRGSGCQSLPFQC
jgi:hypothetical protein